MAKAQTVSVWTIAWGVFWGLALWTILTTIIAVFFWGAIVAAVFAGSSRPTQQVHTAR